MNTLKLLTSAFFLGTILTSNANIIYTDITDATLSSANPLNIDFDGSGTIEFTIEDQSFGGTPEPGIFFNANAHFETEAAFPNTGWDIVKGLSLQTPISNSSGWHDQGDAYIDPGWATNSFPSGTDTYIGAQFNLGNHTHYGWIRVNWNGNGTLILKDFAYESTPNMTINAGDQGTSAVLVTSISVSGANGLTSISTLNGTLQMNSNILPANANNKTITWSVNNGSGSATIDANGLLTATSNDGSNIIGSKVITITNQNVGISEQSILDIKLFPNPAINIVTISGLIQNNQIRIIGIQGKTYLNIITKSSTIHMDIAKLPSGIYFLSIQKDEGEPYVIKSFIKK